MTAGPGSAPVNDAGVPSPARRGAGIPAVLRLFVLPALLGALITTALLYVPRAGWTSNDVTTGEHPGYPDLQPHRYDSAPENTTRFASAAATNLPNWKVVRTDLEHGIVQAEVRVSLTPFTDDVTVTVLPTGPGNASSLVRIRSHSRVGNADLGVNAQHIRALQAAMDDKLPPLAP